MVNAMRMMGLVLATLAGMAQAAPCDGAWQQQVQARLGGDHGPDLGSDEWSGSVEHQLLLRGVPLRGSPAWCQRVQQVLDAARSAPVCRQRNAPGSIAALTCQRAGLAVLDLRLNEAYGAATKKATPAQRKTLAPEQRGWIKGRDDCWKAGTGAEARMACVRDAYRQRLLELQTQFRLTPVHATVRWQCADGQALTTTFFNTTEPASLVAERGGETSLMTAQPAASGARYAGRNESLWEHQGEARVTWGWQAPETVCRQVQP